MGQVTARGLTMDEAVQDRYARVHDTISLRRPDRVPILGRDLCYIEYRKDLYHLGENESVGRGQVGISRNGKRRVTWDGGVWAVDAKEKYRDAADVLQVDVSRFPVEEIGPAMLSEMNRLWVEAAARAFPVPLHYGTLMTRAVIEFGWEPFLMASALDPQRLGEILDRFGQASLAVVEGWCQIEGTELIAIHDDIGATRGPIMRPEWCRRYLFPWYSRIFGVIHEHGRKVLYVSDGNYLPVLDDVLATNPDGLYVESSSMEPAEVMRRAGPAKLFMVKTDSRNIDLGTPAEIREEMLKLRALHAEYPGILMYRGGGDPLPGNAEAFEQCYLEFLVYR